MFTHEQIWDAIDKLADRYHMSVSALAKLAGLDPATFNRSTRYNVEGRRRWPSTESLAKILAATSSTVEDFFAAVCEPAPRTTLPLIGFTQAGTGGFFDDSGLPTGHGWDEIFFPEVADPSAYAIEITGNSLLPAYRDGDTIIAAPKVAARRGDRVLIQTIHNELSVKELGRQTNNFVELHAISTVGEDLRLPTKELTWMARIIWCSQ